MQWSKGNKFKQLTATLTAAALFFTSAHFTMPAQAAQLQAKQTNLALNTCPPKFMPWTPLPKQSP